VTAVDLHTHFLPRFFVDEAGAGEVFGVRVEDGLVIHPQGFRYPVHPTFVDVEAKLAEMDAAGIDVSVLSSAPTLFFYDAPAAEAVGFARRSNDALAEMAGASPRLAGLATLPLQDPEGAAAELERAVAELGLHGAHIGTNCGTFGEIATGMKNAAPACRPRAPPATATVASRAKLRNTRELAQPET